jgi:glutathione S-transferase
LEEAAISYEGIEVSWRRNVNVDKLAAVNPLGQVPAIQADFGVLTQTHAILEYAADHGGVRGLLPAAGTPNRDQARAWLSFIAADFQKGFLPLGFADRWTQNPDAQNEIRAAAKEGVNKHLAYINHALAGKSFVLGEDYSLVDAYLFVILGWCKWSKVSLAPYANIQPYLRRVYERPAVQKILKDEDLLDFFPA